MIRRIDTWLNSVTMYRLMVLGLLVSSAFALFLSCIGSLSFAPLHLVVSFFVLVWGSYGLNFALARLVRAVPNAESSAITGMLLFFLLDPTIEGWVSVGYLFLAVVFAQGSKYIFAFRKKHLFNPVAIAAVLLFLFQIPLGIWWVATPWMLIPILPFGVMVARKLRRVSVVALFVLTAVIVGWFRGVDPLTLFLSWPVVFFGTLMFTEPRTAPLRDVHRYLFAVLVGVLFSAQFSLGWFATTPEFALIIGNLFAYLVSSKQVLRLTLKEFRCETEQICHFIFTSDQPLRFQAGQYLEWTLPLQKSDSRGNRRYFTIASAPSETEIHLGSRIDREHSSAFKRQLLALKPGDHILASHVSGDFILSDKQNRSSVWIAGGIGITPFRSMARELIARGERRDIVLLYCVNLASDIAYKQEIDTWFQEAGIRVEYVVAKPDESWKGLSGYLTADVLSEAVSDASEREWFISGPPMMVASYVKLAESLGTPRAHVRTDYFPGF